MTKSMKLGGGGRFQKLARKLKARDPKALAAWIGRKKYGKKRMTKWSIAGRKRAKRK